LSIKGVLKTDFFFCKIIEVLLLKVESTDFEMVETVTHPNKLRQGQQQTKSLASA